MDRAGGARGRRAAGLLVPQDGVLVVELQLLHRSAAGLLSTAVPVFHNLKCFLHFSISETQTHESGLNETCARVEQYSHLNSTYLRVSTCLAEASKEGNCASLNISGGPWLMVRLVVVSRAPGGRYTPAGFASGTSSSSAARENPSEKQLISQQS